MNIRDLKYLVALADNKHFGNAADACYVSQPTLSMQIKKLEDELGVTFFERNNKQLITTPIGEKIIEQARLILKEVDELKSIAQLAKDPFSGNFRLGVIPTLGPYLLPLILPAIKKQLPKINLIIFENKTDVIVKQLLQGKLDAVLLALPIHEQHLKHVVLFKEPFYLAMPENHALAKKQKIQLKDLKHADLLLLEEGHCLRDQALEACQWVDVKEKQGFQATSLETLRHLVAANFGITLLPELAVQSAGKHKNLVTKPFASPSPQREIGMLWRQTCARDVCCEKIAEVIKRKMTSH
jgi:LysR family hydrogen peroxide-inducible transcriptional activator